MARIGDKSYWFNKTGVRGVVAGGKPLGRASPGGKEKEEGIPEEPFVGHGSSTARVKLAGRRLQGEGKDR